MYTTDNIHVGNKVKVANLPHGSELQHYTKGIVTEVIPHRNQIMVEPEDKTIMDIVRFDVSQVVAASPSHS